MRQKTLKQRLLQSGQTQKLTLAIVVIAIAALGTFLIIGSHAASPYISTTADSGTVANGATKKTCAGASDGNCVLFNTSSVGGQQANCLQLQSDGLHPVYATLDSCNYPSPDTAGVPSGTTLTTVGSSCGTGCLPPNTTWTGSELAITGPTTINDLNIPGNIYFVASDFSNPSQADVTIENSKIQASTGATLIDLQGAGHVTIKYTQVSGTYSGSTCTGPASYDIADGGTANVLDHDVLSCAGEPVNGSGFTLTNSYLFVDGYPAGEHLEDFYIPGKGSADIENNTLLQPNDQTAAIFGDAKLGALNGVTIKNNLIAEGGNNGNVAIGCVNAGVPNEGYGYDTNVVVENNRLSTVYDTASSPFASGNTDGGTGTTWLGNYMDNAPSDIVSQPIGPC